MSLGLATRAIIEALLKSKGFCTAEKTIRGVLKGYGYSEKSAYVYIHRLSKRGVVNRHRTGAETQICLKLERLRDLGLIVILLR